MVPRIVVLISADAEWRVVREHYSWVVPGKSPFGETLSLTQGGYTLDLVQGGWGKIAAAASCQYACDAYHPDLLVNLGTCGGLQGLVPRGAVLLVERTLVYDIIEQMGDPVEAIAHYTTEVDLSFLHPPYPQEVWRGLLVSADRDIVPADIPMLRSRYAAIAADWESGAIAWTAARNHKRLLILRGVTDLVNEEGGEAYGSLDMFRTNTRQVMTGLLAGLPAWLDCVFQE
ncbi:MAG TPA: 5'-methylthioadenosine/S-adenosylhomocysteine nucleosidase [Anaerolineaceae bacterium]